MESLFFRSTEGQTTDNVMTIQYGGDMETVGAYEAKTHLPKLLDRVARGERIVITRHGVPVAVLQPPEPSLQMEPEAVIRELMNFRKGRRLDGDSIREMIEEGRR